MTKINIVYFIATCFVYDTKNKPSDLQKQCGRMKGVKPIQTYTGVEPVLVMLWSVILTAVTMELPRSFKTNYILAWPRIYYKRIRAISLQIV